jgi:predicted GIY-YIG superfamily endonuclease
MTDYSKTVIYKIQHLDKDELLYVGHTTNFTKRKNYHKNNSIEKTTPVYKMMRENGGWECFTMIVLKDFPCASKTEACIEEDKVMREMKASMNTIRSYVSSEDRLELNKQKCKLYQQANTEQISKQRKEFRQANKELISERRKAYYQANKELINEKDKNKYQANREFILEQNKEYRQANKDKIKEQKREPMECECGCIIRKSDLARHKKSKKHLSLTI